MKQYSQKRKYDTKSTKMKQYSQKRKYDTKSIEIKYEASALLEKGTPAKDVAGVGGILDF